MSITCLQWKKKVWFRAEAEKLAQLLQYVLTTIAAARRVDEAKNYQQGMGRAVKKLFASGVSGKLKKNSGQEQELKKQMESMMLEKSMGCLEVLKHHLDDKLAINVNKIFRFVLFNWLTLTQILSH